MKRFLLGLVIVAAALVAGLALVAARYDPTLPRNTFAGPVDVGGLTPEAAARKLRVWWEAERRREVQLKSAAIKGPLPSLTPSRLGLALDDAATIAQIPTQDFVQATSSGLAGVSGHKRYGIVFKRIPAELGVIEKLVAEQAGKGKPARVLYIPGKGIKKVPEVPGMALDVRALAERLVPAIQNDGILELPLAPAPPRVPDEELAKVTAVMGEFSTKFPAYQTSRNTNIRLASERLNGIVLMPGETVSFNDTVGRRTVAGGFKMAPVLRNGMHDVGIGGGICQVSTTLYNAALLANLKIKRRHNHSIPSVYAPVGRDATVDYGTLDLVIENSSPHAIAITSEMKPGQLFFRVLGQKEPGLEVKIATEGHKSWSRGVKTVTDPRLPAGRTRVLEKGGRGHSISVYRLVYKDGALLKKEPLGTSTYRGMDRIIAVGARSAAPRAAARPPSAAPAAAPAAAAPAAATPPG